MTISPRTMVLFKKLMDQGILQHPDMSLMPIPAQAPQPNKQDFATYLAMHSSGNKSVANALGSSIATRQDAQQAKEGILSKIFDTLSIPLQTMVGVEHSIAQSINHPKGNFLENLGSELGGVGKSLLGGAVRLADAVPGNPINLVGQDRLHQIENNLLPKHTNADILGQDFGVKNPILKYGGGFALDIATDPLSYIGPGAFFRGAKSAKDILDAKAAAPNGALNHIFNTAKAEAGGLKRPEAPHIQMPPVAESALRPAASVMNPVQDLGVAARSLSRQTIGTPLMDAATEAAKFQPRTRGLQRFIDSGQQTEQLAIRENKLASDVSRGLVDIPNPARDATQKMMRAQGDWERAMMKAGQVVDKTGRFSTRAAADIIKGIADGTVPNNVINPARATGDLLNEAKQVADHFVDTAAGQRYHPGLKRWVKSDSNKLTKRQLPSDLTAPQQVALYQSILKHTNVKTPEEAQAVLASAEDHLISLGVQPVAANGMRVRLSHVLAAVGDNVPLTKVLQDFPKSNMKNVDPAVRAAIHGLSAQRSMNMADIVGHLTELTQKAKQSITDNYSTMDQYLMKKNLINAATDNAVQMGASSKEMQAIRDLIKDVVNVDNLPTDNWVMAANKELIKAADEGRVHPDLVNEFNKRVAQAFGFGTMETLGKRVVGAKVVDSFMLHFTTWWGRGIWRQVSQDVFDAGVENAARRGAAMRYVAKTYDPAVISEAWRHASGMKITQDPAALQLSNFFTDYMRQVFKVHDQGVKAENALNQGLSVAEKSQTLMKDINRHLKIVGGANAFQFSAKRAARDALGNRHDFSAPGDWMKSWSMFDPKDPVSFIYNLDVAMERVTKEYAFQDDFVSRYGSLTRDAEHNFAMPLSRIKGFYVPENVGREFLRVWKDLEKGGYHPHSPLMRFYAKGLRIFKTGVTIYLPSHHIRNAIGDTYLMWLAGHQDPRAFIWAKRIMASQRTMYRQAIKRGDFTTLEQLTSPEAMKWAETRGGDIILNQNGTRLTADQIYIAAHQHGLLTDANKLEDIYAEAPLGEVSIMNNGMKKILTQPFGGKVRNAAVQAAEYREHYIRLAHFTSAINKSLKSGKKDLKTIFEEAAHEVRKWHPDGRDLTYQEQKLRMLIPFYSWTRKSTPLLVQSMVTAPARNLVYPRGMNALQGMLGIQTDGVSDPYPDNQMFPEWIRAYGVGPIGDPQSSNAIARWWGNLGRNMLDINGQPYGYTQVNPSNPLLDFGQQFLGFGPKDTIEGIYNSLTPAATIPLDLAKNSDFSGAPIFTEGNQQGQGVLHYLSKQMPMLTVGQNVMNIGDRQRAGVENNGLGPFKDREALLNLLTAMGIHGTGPYIKSAQFESKRAAGG